jgi:hypothetical protein
MFKKPKKLMNIINIVTNIKNIIAFKEMGNVKNAYQINNIAKVVVKHTKKITSPMQNFYAIPAIANVVFNNVLKTIKQYVINL